MISKNVSKGFECEDMVFYRINCSCGCDDKLDISLEYDKEFNLISMEFYKKLYWKEYFSDGNVFVRFWYRIRDSLKLLLFGYLEIEESLMLESTEQLDSFIEALQEGKAKLEDYAKENQKNPKN
jgi:hypothetical protein